MSRATLALIPTCALLSAMTPARASIDQPISLSTTFGELRGSLMFPTADKSQTIALIISGSGPTDRDGNNPLAKNDSLKMLAEALANGGIASVRYDKRGVGESATARSDESKVVFQDLVADAKSWISLLAVDRRFANVVVIGHSEGATIGMLAAQHSAVSAYVSIAGPARSASQGLRSQLAGKLPPDLAERSEQILIALEGGRPVQDVPPALMALYRPSVQPYLIDWFKVVPTDEFKRLRVPCLIVQGDTDIQIPVTAAQALHAANPKSEIVVVEGMNHVLKLVPDDHGKQLASYRDASLPIAPVLSDSIVRFIRSHASSPANR
jgi:pimeloyl-ACP methyl ester carboxylesterase